jgi:O-antigen ligase
MNFKLVKKDRLIVAVTAVFVLLTFIQGFVSQIVRIGQIDLIDDLILSVFFIFSIIFAFRNKLPIKKNYLFIFIYPFIFLVYLFITGIINKIPLIIIAVSFRDYFQYILFFFFLIVFFTEYMFEIINRFILFFGILLLVSSVYQIARAIFQNNFHSDFITGTMGQSGAHLLSAVLVFYVGFYLSKINFEGEINKKEILYLLLIIILLIIAAFRALLLFLPIILIIYVLINKIYRKKLFLIITSAAIVSVFIILFIIDKTRIYHFNIRYMFEEQLSSDSGGRIFQFKYIFNSWLDNPVKLLFGTGPGSFFSKSTRYFNYERWSWVKNNLKMEGYIQYVITLAEIGFIGLISIIVFYILLLKRLINNLNGNISSIYKVIIAATIFYIITYLFLGIGGNVFEWQEANMILWFYIAYSYKVCAKNEFSIEKVSQGTARPINN